MNLTIEQLYRLKKISARSFNVCCLYNLTTIEDIANYYLRNRTFINLKNAGEKTEVQLIKLSNEYLHNKDFWEISLTNDSDYLDKIENNNQLSQKTIQLLIENNITTTLKLIEHFNKTKSFWNLLQKDSQFVTELYDFYFVKSGQFLSSVRFSFRIIDVYNDLDSECKILLDDFCEIAFNRLSNTTKTSLYDELNKEVTFKTIIMSMVLKRIESLGMYRYNQQKIINEFVNFSNVLLSLFYHLLENNKVTNQIIAIHLFSLNSNIEFQSNNENTHSCEFLFEIVNKGISNNFFFPSENEKIVMPIFNIFENVESKTLRIVAKGRKLTLERIRQILWRTLEKFPFRFNPLFLFDDDIISRFEIPNNGFTLEVTPEIIQKINFESKSNFSYQFGIFILSYSCYNTYSLLGNIDNILVNWKSSKKTVFQWSSFYLIKKEFENYLDYDSFMKDIHVLYTEKRKKEQHIDCKEIIQSHIWDKSLELTQEFLDGIYYILNREFPNIKISNNQLILSRNSHRNLHEYLIEVLDAIGKQSHVDEIYEKLLEMYPDYNFKKSSLIATLINHDEFIHIGRSSIFALIRWEKDNPNFKGGAIKRIIIEYLQEHQKPMSVKDITIYVQKFRKTSLSYVMSRVRADKDNNFYVYENFYIGLQKFHKDEFRLIDDDKRDLRTLRY